MEDHSRSIVPTWWTSIMWRGRSELQSGGCSLSETSFEQCRKNSRTGDRTRVWTVRASCSSHYTIRDADSQKMAVHWVGKASGQDTKTRPVKSSEQDTKRQSRTDGTEMRKNSRKIVFSTKLRRIIWQNVWNYFWLFSEKKYSKILFRRNWGNPFFQHFGLNFGMRPKKKVPFFFKPQFRNWGRKTELQGRKCWTPNWGTIKTPLFRASFSSDTKLRLIIKPPFFFEPHFRRIRNWGS